MDGREPPASHRHDEALRVMVAVNHDAAKRRGRRRPRNEQRANECTEHRAASNKPQRHAIPPNRCWVHIGRSASDQKVTETTRTFGGLPISAKMKTADAAAWRRHPPPLAGVPRPAPQNGA